MTKRLARRLGLLGAALIAAGLAWGIVFVGVPYQDPTPEMVAEMAYHDAVSDNLMLGGLILVAAGLAVAVIARLRT